MRRHGLAFLCLLAAASLGGGCAAQRFLEYVGKPDAPHPWGDEAVRGLDAPVQVVFDEHAVPHVLAASERDLFFAMGWLQARERRFQMEMLRHAAEGRLSELFGNRPGSGGTFGDTLATDRWFRVFGLHRQAKAAVRALPADDRALLDAFVAGVNEAIRTGRAPIELRLLGVETDPWQAEDVLAIGRLQGWQLSLNLVHELARYVLVQAWGLEKLRAADPPVDAWGPVIVNPSDRPATGPGSPPPVAMPPSSEAVDVPPGWDRAVVAVLEGLAGVQDGVARLSPEASNNWVIGPAHSATGRPILANDPHLAHTAPSTFYLMHLSAPGIDAVGATLPGVPAVLLGHNRHLAWGATTTFADVQDVYLEKPDPDDPTRYLTPSGPQPYVVEDEPILERTPHGMVTHPFQVRRTRHGAVLNDAVPKVLPLDGPTLALRTAMDDPGEDVGAMRRVLRASTVGDFRDAMRNWGTPIQNWVVADDAGHIGYLPAGHVPRRKGWDGTVPVPGWTGEFEWDGWIPFDELPQLWDPPSGRIVTANNNVIRSSDYPWPFSRDAMPGYRAARILEVLDSKPLWTADEVRALQTDDHVTQADRLLPVLLDALANVRLNDHERKVRDLLAAWDRRASIDSAGAVAWFATYREAWRLALEDDLPPVARGLFHAFNDLGTFFDRAWEQEPNAWFWDIKGTRDVEDRDTVLRAAFGRTVAWLYARLGDDPSKWQWRTLHRVEFAHAFGRDAMLRKTFGAGPTPIPGAQDTVWAAGGVRWDADGRFTASHGPVFRHVIELGRPEESGMVVDLGQSGWPGTPRFTNALKDWSTGRLWNVRMDPDGFGRDPLGTLSLRPAPASR